MTDNLVISYLAVNKQVEASMELIGRYLCLAYYRGEIIDKRVKECVEKILRDESGKRDWLSNTWRQLLIGSLAKLNTSARQRVLGGRASLDSLKGIYSLDGREAFIRENEQWLYILVGEEFRKMVSEK